MWGRLSRRDFLVSGAAAAVSLKGLASTPGCVLTSEQEEGPYYVGGATLRRDVTEGRPGVPVLLRIAVMDSRRCAPLAHAALDIWHCDAEGVYSGFTSGRPGSRGIDETRFLRGVQMTNEDGVAEFETLYRAGIKAGRSTFT